MHAALAGLDPVDREISELNLRHGFYGADLADILGVTPSHAHALASRARSRLERSLGGHKRSGFNLAILLDLQSAIPLPTGLRWRTLRLISDGPPTAVAQCARVLDRAARFGADGFPVQVTKPSIPRRRVTSVAAVGTAATMALLGGGMYYANHSTAHDPASVAVGQPGPTGTGESARASAGGGPQSRAQIRSVRARTGRIRAHAAVRARGSHGGRAVGTRGVGVVRPVYVADTLTVAFAAILAAAVLAAAVHAACAVLVGAQHVSTLCGRGYLELTLLASGLVLNCYRLAPGGTRRRTGRASPAAR